LVVINHKTKNMNLILKASQGIFEKALSRKYRLFQYGDDLSYSGMSSYRKNIRKDMLLFYSDFGKSIKQEQYNNRING